MHECFKINSRTTLTKRCIIALALGSFMNLERLVDLSCQLPQVYGDYMSKLLSAKFTPEAYAAVGEEAYFVDMMRDDEFDDDDVLIAEVYRYL